MFYHHCYSHAQLEELADNLNRRYDAERLKRPARIDVYDVVDLLGARLAFEYLSPDRTYLGATIFRNGSLYVWPGNPYVKNMMPKEKLFYGGTIIIDRDLSESTKEQDRFSENFTVIHECFHYAKHQSSFRQSGHMSRSFSDYGKKQVDKKDALFWIEHQANYSAAAFLMPRNAVEYGARHLLHYRGKPLPFGFDIKDDIKELGNRFGVNYSPIVYRLQTLNILKSKFDPYI
ncbi:MAG: ImmA/IrrE family metallo-endopeptidase [Thermoguttaceae bacterium]|nr:ImmA/IrrE family metallo-endopeptidase [Thermoguttaceae bacterium]MBQ5368288.1 ImmA/IrrE family metallo-endopeptidase [Thermoguttaceae bacterium]